MNDLVPLPLLNNATNDLPKEVVTRNGARFNPRLDRWTYRDGVEEVSINFDKLHAQIELINASKKVLIWYAENMSTPHLRNMFYYFSHFLSVVCLDQNKV